MSSPASSWPASSRVTPWTAFSEPVREHSFATSRPGVILSSLATAVAAFLLYTNLLVVAAEHGLVPTAASIVIPALLLAAVLHRVALRREPIIVDRTFLVMLAFLGVLLVSGFTVKGYAEAIARIETFCIEGLTMYFLARNAIRDLTSLRRTIVALILAATFLSGLSLFQAATQNYRQDFLGLAQHDVEHTGPGANPDGDVMGLADRARGPVGDPNRFAQILMMVLPLAFVAWRDARSRTRALIALACLAGILGGIVVTYSRGGFLALVVLLLLCAPLGLLRAKTVLMIVAAGVLAAPVLAPAYTKRVLSITGVAALWGRPDVEADGATRGRTTEMLSALAAFIDHPILGVGPGQYVEYYSRHYQALPEVSVREISEPRRAHDLYLELAAEGGMVGLVVFLDDPASPSEGSQDASDRALSPEARARPTRGGLLAGASRVPGHRRIPAPGLRAVLLVHGGPDRRGDRGPRGRGRTDGYRRGPAGSVDHLPIHRTLRSKAAPWRVSSHTTASPSRPIPRISIRDS